MPSLMGAISSFLTVRHDFWMKMHLYRCCHSKACVTVTYIDAAAKDPGTARPHVLIFRGEESAGRVYRDADTVGLPSLRKWAALVISRGFDSTPFLMRVSAAIPPYGNSTCTTVSHA
jgi:hypothetical protein